MKALKTHVFWGIGIALAYIVITVYVSEFYVTIQYLPVYLSTINWVEFTASILLTIIIALLVGTNSVYAYKKYQERKPVKGEAAMSCVGTIGGVAAGVCPACVTSVFPLILGVFGISVSWATLPLKGFEIQLLVIALLGISLYLLHKK